MKTCKFCGHKVPNGENQCTNCGHSNFYMVHTGKGADHRRENDQLLEIVLDRINSSCGDLQDWIREYDNLLVYYRGLKKRGVIADEELKQITDRLKYRLPRPKDKSTTE